MEFYIKRNKLLKAGAKFRGIWEIEVYDKLGGKLIGQSSCQNIITDEGLNRILNVMLHAATAITTWYVELYESNTAGAANMTYDVPTYTICTAYAEGARPAYVEAESTAKSTTNSANKAVFTMNASKTIYGSALVSVTTAGDHTAGANNVLFCAGLYTTAQPVISGNVVNATYTVTAADAG